jgi:hypothetical protein
VKPPSLFPSPSEQSPTLASPCSLPGVELEVVVAGADVVGAGEHALHDQPDAHGVEEAEVLRHAVLAHQPRVLPAHAGVRVGPLPHDQDEHGAEQDVAHVAGDAHN